MAGNILSTLSIFEGVAVNNIATRTINPVGVLHGIQLGFFKNDNTALSWAELIADVETIFIKIGGDIAFEMTPSEIGHYLNYYLLGANPANAIFHLPLKPFWWSNTALANQLAWGTALVGSGQIVANIRFKSPNGGLQTSRVECNMDSTANRQPLGTYLQIKRFPFAQPNAGTIALDSFPREENVAILGYLIVRETAGVKAAIDTVEMRFDDISQRQEVAPVYLDRWAQMRGRKPLANMLPIDLNVDSNAADFVRLSQVLRQTLQIKTTDAGLGNFAVLRIAAAGVAAQAPAIAQIAPAA